jgi:hypothetical protein
MLTKPVITHGGEVKVIIPLPPKVKRNAQRVE